MAFPSTGILDDFNRSENPLSTNWAGPVWSGDATIQANGTTAQGNGAFAQAYRNNTTYGPDAESYLTVSTEGPDGSAILLLIRIAQPNTSVDGYVVRVDKSAAADSWSMIRTDNEADTQLGAAFTQEIATGDSIGAEMIGTTLAAYYKAGAGSWVQLTTRTDSTYTGAGFIGFCLNNTTWRADDFGGGTVVTGGVTLTPNVSEGIGIGDLRYQPV